MKLPILIGALSFVLLSSCQNEADNSQSTETQIDTNITTDDDVSSGDATSTDDDVPTSDDTTSTDDDVSSDDATSADDDTSTNDETDSDTQTTTDQTVSVFEQGYVSVSQTNINNEYTFSAHTYGFEQDTQLNFSWNFNDGSELVEAQNVTHVFDFTDAGEFEVMLTVTHGNDEINVGTGVSNEVCDDDYHASIRVLDQNLQTVQFEGAGNKCVNPIDIESYSWDFGDGNTMVTDEPRVAYHYETGGAFDVTFSYEHASAQRSITIESEPAVSSCPEFHNYGERASVLLTADQYNNAVFDITGIEMDADYDINNVDYSLFIDNANSIVFKSLPQRFSNIVDCTYLFENDCSEKYLTEILPKIYQQDHYEITNNDANYKLTEHKALFDHYAFNDAMKYSLMSALTSPQFLFHSQFGETKENVMQQIEMQNDLDLPEERIVGDLIYEHVFDKQTSGQSYEIGLNQLEQLPELTVDQPGTYLVRLYISGTPVEYNNMPPSLEFSINSETVLNYKMITWGGIKRLDIEVTLDELNNELALLNQAYNAVTAERSINIDKVEVHQLIEKPYYFRAAVSEFENLEAGDFILSNWEIASLLSFNYLGTIPDAPLVELAMTKQLDDAQIVAEQIQRLKATDQHMLWVQTNNYEEIQSSDMSCGIAHGELK